MKADKFIRPLSNLKQWVSNYLQSSAQPVNDPTQADNVLFQALYAYIAQNTTLPPIQNKSEAIEIGYKRNPDVYAIVDKLTNMFSTVPLKQVVSKGGKEEDYHDTVIQSIIDAPNNWQVDSEFRNMLYMFYLTLGDGMIYAPTSEIGNNKGKLLPCGMNVIPTQYTWIYGGGWMMPVKEYVINYNQGPQYRMPAEDVIHMRMANPEFKNANNFYGLSPIIVAKDIVQMQLAAYTIAKETYQRGFPPGILSKKDPNQDNNTDEQTRNLSKVWRSKYGQASKAGEPVFTLGDLQWTKLGFDSLKDLDVLGFIDLGMKKLANMWGIPTQLLNDPSGAKYSNVQEARKIVYTNRIIPDLNIYCQKFNAKLWKNYGTDIKVVPDWSKIPELQDDRQKIATTYAIGVNCGAYTRNEFREKLGDQKGDDPALDAYTVTGQAMSLDVVVMSEPPEIEEEETDEEDKVVPMKPLKSLYGQG